jgi:hypothetical protein
MPTFQVFLQERDAAQRRLDCGTYKGCATKEDAVKRAQIRLKGMASRLTMANSWAWEAVLKR